MGARSPGRDEPGCLAISRPGRVSDLPAGVGLAHMGSVAAALGVSTVRVERDWRLARAWLASSPSSVVRALRTMTHGFRDNADQSDNRRPRLPLENPASVDPTEARMAAVRRFGGSDRSRLKPGDGITCEERGVKVRDAAQLRPGVGLGPG
jgi:hypothetical protein